jgi:hypothetical protein
MQPASVHAQAFTADWPGVLEDMLEFVTLTQLSLGRGRAPQVQVTLSRERVAADRLQPHVDRFRARMAQQLPQARLQLRAEAVPDHRVEVRFAP